MTCKIASHFGAFTIWWNPDIQYTHWKLHLCDSARTDAAAFVGTTLPPVAYDPPYCTRLYCMLPTLATLFCGLLPYAELLRTCSSHWQLQVGQGSAKLSLAKSDRPDGYDTEAHSGAGVVVDDILGVAGRDRARAAAVEGRTQEGACGSVEQ